MVNNVLTYVMCILTMVTSDSLLSYNYSYKYNSFFPYNLSHLQSIQDKDQNKRKEKAFETLFKDSVLIRVDLIYDKNEQPIEYYSHIQTPVCEEGLCYQMIINIYWDLLGNFHKYELPPNDPLTKFDHIKFTPEDHQKMYGILSDKESFLRDYKMEDLIDHSVQIKSETEVDAVSGATHRSIKSAVVEGAVYSTHTLWHIVNGEVADKILQHTEALFDKSLFKYFLNSDNYHYQYYALNIIPEENLNEYLPYIIRLALNGSSYVPYFAIEKIPEYAWKSAEYQEKLLNSLGELEFEMQNEFLNRLKGVQLSKFAIIKLINNLGHLEENQMIRSLIILFNNQATMDNEMKKKLSPLVDHPNQEIADLTTLIIQ